MKDIECPYCSSELYINHDDGYGYSESDIHQQQCGKCEKYFTDVKDFGKYSGL